MATDSRTHTVYLADGNQIVAVDERTGVATSFGATLGGTVDLVAVDSVLAEVFVAVDDAHGTYQIKALAGPSLSTIATIPMAGSVRAMTVDERSHTLVAVGNADTGGVATFIDERLNAVRGSAAVGTSPAAVAVDDVRGIAYVANETENTVSVVSLDDDMSVNDVIPVGEQPAGVAVDQLSHEAFVTNHTSNSVSVIASTLDPTGGAPAYSVIKTVDVAGNPWGVAVDSTTHVVYVAPEGGHSVTLLDGLSGDVSEVVPLAAGNLFHVAIDESLNTASVIARIDPAITLISPALDLAPAPTCSLTWCR
ncbi:MAG: hypothetical protein JWQ64_844 [Subtercola sp.]|nr:hypothetical protein [Subtercola sp.]